MISILYQLAIRENEQQPMALNQCTQLLPNGTKNAKMFSNNFRPITIYYVLDIIVPTFDLF